MSWQKQLHTFVQKEWNNIFYNVKLHSIALLLISPNGKHNNILPLHLCSVPRDQRQAGRSLKKKAAKMLNVTMINRPCGIAYACSKLFMLCSAASENS